MGHTVLTLFVPLTISLTLLASASAAPLAVLAPAENFAALGWTNEAAPATDVWKQLTTDLGKLDWERARRTVDLLQRALVSSIEQPLDSSEEFEWRRTCPTLLEFGADETDGSEFLSAGFKALLTASAASHNPIPAATAIFRTSPAAARPLGQLQENIVRCARRSGLEVRRPRRETRPFTSSVTPATFRS